MSIDGYLTFEDGLVKLGNDLLPGLLVQQSIRCAVRYDSANMDHMSGTKKHTKGWEDATITLTLDLLSGPDEVNGKTVSSTCYDKLKIINNLFRGKTVHPKVYQVTGKHLAARGIRQVVFDSLYSDECDQDDVMQVTLTFVEHLPPVIKRETQANAQKKVSQTAPQIKPQPAPAPAVMQDSTHPLIDGIKAVFN